MNVYDTSYGFAHLRDHCPVLAEFAFPFYIKLRNSVGIQTEADLDSLAFLGKGGQEETGYGTILAAENETEKRAS